MLTEGCDLHDDRESGQKNNKRPQSRNHNNLLNKNSNSNSKIEAILRNNQNNKRREYLVKKSKINLVQQSTF